MYIVREEEGVWLRDLQGWVVDTLLRVPEWLEGDDPDVQARLLPNAYEDDERDREWREALGGSLEHLFASRIEIVRGDLRRLEATLPEFEGEDEGDDEEDEECWVDETLFSVWIPAAHVSAWVSTLQAGSHALFILDGLTAEDVDHEAPTPSDPDKQVSVVRLSLLQSILVELLEE